MKRPQTNWHNVLQYLISVVRQIIGNKKRSLVSISLFIIILLTSYFWDEQSSITSQSTSESLSKHQQYHCQLQKIIDGDTIIADCNSAKPQQVKIRIWGMDAPEMKQKPWGDKAKKALENIFHMNKHDTILIKIRDIDQYNRYVGQIYINNQEIDVGLKMVSEGFAVVYHQYNKDPLYRREESKAQDAKKGIWKFKGSQQDPASWRKVNPF